MEKIILLVLVTIAKVIGILLTVLVIVALAILFAAVRYCGKISFDDKKAQISIRWLGVFSCGGASGFVHVGGNAFMYGAVLLR